jgi:hypothetical protein
MPRRRCQRGDTLMVAALDGDERVFIEDIDPRVKRDDFLYSLEFIRE